MTFPISRGDFRVAIESSYNNSTTLTKSNAIYLETVAIKSSAGSAPRAGISPWGPGWKSYSTTKTGELTGQALLSTYTLASAATLPAEDPLLQMIGFDAGTGAGATGSFNRKYVLLAHGHKSVKCELREYDSGDALNTLTTLTGVRAAGVIKLVGKGAATLDFTGQSSVNTKVNEAKGPGHADNQLAITQVQPAVGGAGLVTITELAGPTVFAGILYDAEFTLYPILVAEGLASRVVTIRPAGVAVGIKMTLDAQALSTFDAHALLAAETALSYHIELPQAASGVNNLEIDGTMQFKEVSDDDGPAGNRVWGIDAMAVFPQVSSDGGGVVPVQDVFSVTYRTTA